MLKVKYKTHFQDIWLENEEYKPGLQRVENDPHIAAHSITVLKTHAKGPKH